jgi:hypothetical protein
MVDFNRVNEIAETMRSMSDRELLEAIFIKLSMRETSAPRSAETRASAPTQAGAGGACFPPYGRSKGQPVSGASMGDLEFYRNGCLRTLGDPAKSRWHDKERTLLAAIEAEIIRQRGAQPVENYADPSDSWGTGGGSPAPDRGYGGPPPGFDERPPPDDDVPF